MSNYVPLAEITDTVPCALCARAVRVVPIFGEDPEANVCDGCSVATSFVPAEGTADAVTLLAAVHGSSARWDILAPAFTELADMLGNVRSWRDAGLTPAEALAGQPFGWLHQDSLKPLADAAAADAFQSEAQRNRAAAEAAFRSRVAAADPQQMGAADWSAMRRMSHATAVYEDNRSGTVAAMSRVVR